MIKHLRYIKYVLLHKYYVFRECLNYGLVWQGLIHDWTKFLPSEWSPYVEYFYGDGGKGAFDVAWNHHQKRNPHHWQYWLLREDNPEARLQLSQHLLQAAIEVDQFGLISDATMQDGTETVIRNFFKILPMPDKYRKEMLCDWRGAGQAQGKPRDETIYWYVANKDNIFLHPDTEAWIEKELKIINEKT